VNRRVDESGGQQADQRIDELNWTKQELDQGKLIKIRGFPKDKKVKLFWVTVSTNRTEFVASNDLIPSVHGCRTRCVWYPLAD